MTEVNEECDAAVRNVLAEHGSLTVLLAIARWMEAELEDPSTPKQLAEKVEKAWRILMS